MKITTLDFLDRAREYADTPFIVTSAYRCEEHNKNVGGKPTSSHLKGFAVDISCPTSTARSKILPALIKAGFTRIGIGSNFIHVDDDISKPTNLIWTY